jgi:hypothetical protein
MGQMALQYGMTGYVKRLVVGEDIHRGMTMSEELVSAIAGGVLVSPFSSSVECVMIQQQRKVCLLIVVEQDATSLKLVCVCVCICVCVCVCVCVYVCVWAVLCGQCCVGSATQPSHPHERPTHTHAHAMHITN